LDEESVRKITTFADSVAWQINPDSAAKSKFGSSVEKGFGSSLSIALLVARDVEQLSTDEVAATGADVLR